jgi:hypothetical protein
MFGRGPRLALLVLVCLFSLSRVLRLNGVSFPLNYRLAVGSGRPIAEKFSAPRIQPIRPFT